MRTEKVGRARRCTLVPYAFEGISTWLQRLDRFAQVLERTKGPREDRGARPAPRSRCAAQGGHVCIAGHGGGLLRTRWGTLISSRSPITATPPRSYSRRRARYDRRHEILEPSSRSAASSASAGCRSDRDSSSSPDGSLAGGAGGYRARFGTSPRWRTCGQALEWRHLSRFTPYRPNSSRLVARL